MIKLLIDENLEKSLVESIRERDFDAVYVGEDYKGIGDEEIIKKALFEKRIIITNDLDFGKLVFVKKLKHSGIILLRLADESIEIKERLILNLLNKFGEKLIGRFVVLEIGRVRIR